MRSSRHEGSSSIKEAAICIPKRNQGFTLVELMVVIAVIAIISALALPSFMNTRQASNETSAINSLRTLTTANTQYQVRFAEYAPAIGDLANTGYIDEVLGVAPNEKSGYAFVYTLIDPQSDWQVTATPIDNSGERGFFVDSSGVIRFTPDGTAPDVNSNPID